MRQYTARMATTEDAPRLAAWLHENRDKNHYDPTIFGYDSTRVIAVDRDGETVGYLPYQLTIMTDALAPKPGRTLPEIARFLKEAIHAVVRIARQSRIGEVYFLCAPEDTATAEFARKHGYEEIPFKVFRLRPQNMVPPLDEDS